MKIGILAYGSLIDDPDVEIAAATAEITRGVQTPFRVEFARSSSTRGRAPTLVPVNEGGANVSAIIYRVATDEQTAADILYRREIHKVGEDRRYKEPAPHKRGVVRIQKLDRFEGYDLVLSTRIDANIAPLTASRLADLAIASVATADKGKDGISYLIAAKANGIATALSPAYEAELLARLQANTLNAALEAVCNTLRK